MFEYNKEEKEPAQKKSFKESLLYHYDQRFKFRITNSKKKLFMIGKIGFPQKTS